MPSQIYSISLVIFQNLIATGGLQETNAATAEKLARAVMAVTSCSSLFRYKLKRKVLSLVLKRTERRSVARYSTTRFGRMFRHGKIRILYSDLRVTYRLCPELSHLLNKKETKNKNM